MHQSILVYRNHLYFKVALLAVLLAGMAYLIHTPLGPPNGGTWLGYTLGTVSGLLMIWLAWFGVRKRRYGIGTLKLEDWLSAHVYLGLALAVISTLHAGFQVGWNVHTALYVLMLIVIVSGIFGVYFYIRFPMLLTENRRGMTSEIMLTQIADLDREIRGLAMGLDDATNAAVLKATQERVVGSTLLRQLAGTYADSATSEARRFIEKSGEKSSAVNRRNLLTRLVRKEELLGRVRRDVQLRSLLRVWLMFHIPFSIAALMALAVHVVTVFYYW